MACLAYVALHEKDRGKTVFLRIVRAGGSALSCFRFGEHLIDNQNTKHPDYHADHDFDQADASALGQRIF